MNENIDELLCKLDDEIDRKCLEIKQRNRNKILQTVFITTCVLFIILPIVLIFAGVSLWTFCIPAIIFFTISFSLLSPLALNNKSGGLEI
ncbi:MAG: hypothetical protein Q8873_01455 [Bacillota bacterium]|nr:hypothetical protein [Bacillota bacterium]